MNSYKSLYNSVDIEAETVSANTANITDLDIEHLIINDSLQLNFLTSSRVVQTDASNNLISSNTLNNVTLSGNTNMNNLTANQLLKLDGSKNIVNDNTNYIDEDELDTILNDYVTITSLITTLLDYVTNSSLATTLLDYVTNSSLITTLLDYVTNSSLATTLSNYVTNSSLSTTLSNYVTNSSLATTLSNYLTSATASSTYQTIAGMSSYLTTSVAAATYQTITGMSSYLTTSSASSTYVTKSNPIVTGNFSFNGKTITDVSTYFQYGVNRIRFRTGGSAIYGGITFSEYGLNHYQLLNQGGTFKLFYDSTTTDTPLFPSDASYTGNEIINFTNTGIMRTLNGSDSTPSHSFINFTNCGMWANAANDLRLVTEGAIRLRLTTLNGIIDSNFFPTSNNTYTSGRSGERWSTVYGVNGDFSNTITSGAEIRCGTNGTTTDPAITFSNVLGAGLSASTSTLHLIASSKEMLRLVGASDEILSYYNFLPYANNTRTCGSSASRWSSVFGNNGDFNAVSTGSTGTYSWTSTTDRISRNTASPNAGTGLAFQIGGTNQLWITSNGFIQIRSNTAYKSAGSSWTSASDERLKNSIEDFDVGLDVLDKIRPRKFNYNATGNENINCSNCQKHVGIIAQEMINVYPKCIKTGEDGYYQYDSNDIIYILINSVKELKKEIENLKSFINI